MALGQLKEVVNLDPRSNLADETYFRVMVEGPAGLETLLMTDTELAEIRDRVAMNPEDTEMVPSGWDRFISAAARWF